MRQWHVDPRLLCRKHLLGEHVEHHMFTASLGRRSLWGYVRRGLLDPESLGARHDELAEEMLQRGYRHASPLAQPELPAELQGVDSLVDSAANLVELARRCPACRRIIRASVRFRLTSSKLSDRLG